MKSLQLYLSILLLSKSLKDLNFFAKISEALHFGDQL